MPLGTEVGLGPGDVVLDGKLGAQLPPRKGAQQPPHFSAYFTLAWSPISVAAELLFCFSSQYVGHMEVRRRCR